MKCLKILIPILLASLCASAPFAMADDPKAREIMQLVNDREDGDNVISEEEMILIDKRDKQRVRKIKSFRKDFGEDTHSILFFEEPADVRDTSFLTFDYDDESKDDDQWLYLPALKKVKRIASSDKDGAFMGSDFTYGDMTKRPLSKFEFQLLKEVEEGGHKCWLIESTPINDDVVEEYGYVKSRAFVRQDNYVVIRGQFQWKKGNEFKEMRVEKLELIDGVWTAMEMTMKTMKNQKIIHQTLLRTTSVQYNQALDDTMFTTRRMETGL
ncbi:MAG: outer membrane lipoprotein-sorting protein [Desulfatibacillum sp.]|nr:outer membrane lipoprotein-sorting protein [Desulfatibacillum sp.]